MDLYGKLTENAHLTQQMSSQQVTGNKAAYIGYIQQYDGDRHRVIVVDPLNSAPDPLNVGTPIPMVTGWIPLSTAYAGISNAANPLNPTVLPGIQLAPFGGANQLTPNTGEQVLVINVRSSIGYQVCAFMLFNDTAMPPGGAVPVLGNPIQPGEWLAVNPTGTTVYFDEFGGLNVFTVTPPGGTGDFNLVSNGGIGIQTAAIDTPPVPPLPGDINITTTAAGFINLVTLDPVLGQINFTSAGLIEAVAADAIGLTAPAIIASFVNLALPLITAEFLALYNAHIHPAPGGFTGPPDTQALPVYPNITEALLGG